jgi:hypothetical protein
VVGTPCKNITLSQLTTQYNKGNKLGPTYSKWLWPNTMFYPGDDWRD